MYTCLRIFIYSPHAVKVLLLVLGRNSFCFRSIQPPLEYTCVLSFSSSPSTVRYLKNILSKTHFAYTRTIPFAPLFAQSQLAYTTPLKKLCGVTFFTPDCLALLAQDYLYTWPRSISSSRRDHLICLPYAVALTKNFQQPLHDKSIQGQPPAPCNFTRLRRHPKPAP